MTGMHRWRFSLFDLFIITLGAAAGLAYHRLPNVPWTDALLIACATWIVVGMVQQMRSALGIWRSLNTADRELRHGAALALARPIAAIAMLAAAVGFEAARGPNPEDTAYWPLDNFTASLVSLAVICAYLSPGRRTTSSPRRKGAFHAGLDFLVLLIAAAWLLYVLVSSQSISGLVHMAIRGVEAAQPTRWGGKPFYPFDPQVELARQFFTRAVIAAGAVSVAAICTFLLTAWWDRRAARRLLIAAALGGIICSGPLVHWYWTVGYPTWSPFMASQMGAQPWFVTAAGLSVAAGACFLFVMRYVPEPATSQTAAQQMPPAYHVSGVVMIALLLSMIAGGTPQWDSSMGALVWWLPDPLSDLKIWWDSGASLGGLPRVFFGIVYGVVSYWLDEPKMLLRLAAILVVANQLSRWRRGELTSEMILPIRAGKLLTVSLLATATLLVAIPAGAWLGFAIVTTTFAGL
jgi:hypothetical protein